MSDVLLVVDPGVRYPAAAVFVNGTLVAASRVKLKSAWSKLGRSERCLTVGRAICDWFRDNCPEQPTKLTYVFEWPLVRGRSSKADPADLFFLNGVGMALAGLLYDRFHELKVVEYLPHEWAGTAPKSTVGDPLISPRGVRVWSRLTDEEKKCVVVSHDSVDAIGISLFYLGRFERARSFIGATK